MKYNLFALTLIAVIACMALNSCSKNNDPKSHTETYTYSIYTPVYKSKADIFAGLNSSPNTVITHAGKIYVDGNFIYINEVKKGIHVLDNSDKKNPKQIAFLPIPGNTDIAIKGKILYADMYSDLLAVDISDIHNVKVAKSIYNFFPYYNDYSYKAQHLIQ